MMISTNHKMYLSHGGFQTSGLFLFLLFFSGTGFSQNKWSRLEVGGGISAFIYQGDLTPRRAGSLETAKPGMLLFVNYSLTKKIGVQGSFAWGALKGDDSRYARPVWRKFRNLNFRSPAKEIAFKAHFNILGINAEADYKFAPYISAGVGLGFFNISRNADGFDKKYFETQTSVVNGLQTDLGTATPTKLVTIPIALGVRKYYTERISLFGELNYRFMQTDYLDGFSFAGNSKLKDHFYTISVGAIYKFPKNNSMKCPSF